MDLPPGIVAGQEARFSDAGARYRLCNPDARRDRSPQTFCHQGFKMRPSPYGHLRIGRFAGSGSEVVAFCEAG